MPLFEVDVAEAVTGYVTHREEEFDEPDQEAIRELQQAQESLEREMVVSQRVKASTLEEVDLGTSDTPQPVNVAKEMQPDENMVMIGLLKDLRMFSLGGMRICGG